MICLLVSTSHSFYHFPSHFIDPSFLQGSEIRLGSLCASPMSAAWYLISSFLILYLSYHTISSHNFPFRNFSSHHVYFCKWMRCAVLCAKGLQPSPSCLLLHNISFHHYPSQLSHLFLFLSISVFDLYHIFNNLIFWIFDIYKVKKDDVI